VLVAIDRCLFINCGNWWSRSVWANYHRGS